MDAVKLQQYTRTSRSLHLSGKAIVEGDEPLKECTCPSPNHSCIAGPLQHWKKLACTDVSNFLLEQSSRYDETVVVRMLLQSRSTHNTVRFKQFHGTCVPVLMILFLLPQEVVRLTLLEKFWHRIVSNPMMWKALYCRDFDRCPTLWRRYSGSSLMETPHASQRGVQKCVWRMLHSRSGAEQCLFHLEASRNPKFFRVCKTLTGIPGRSREELLESYVNWRKQGTMVRKMAST